MRWQTKSIATVGILAAFTCLPSVCRGGWITLTSGLSGTATPSSGASDLWYSTSPGIPPGVAVTQVSGIGSIQATTGGGTIYFGGLGTPVYFNLADGTAYLTGGELPPGAIARSPSGIAAGALASTTPQSGISVPSSSTRLGLNFENQGIGNGRSLTVSVSDSGGANLGKGTLAIPENGWWVLGLGPDQPLKPDPGPIDDSDGDSGAEPIPVPVPTPNPTPGVPEPSTLALASLALAGLGLTALRTRRRETGCPLVPRFSGE